MRTQGTLIKWNEERGFGFAKTRDTGIEVFTHVSEFPRGGRRPQIGDPLSFEIVSGDDGRKRARAIVFEVPATGRADYTLAPTDKHAARPRPAPPPRTPRETYAGPRRPKRARRERGFSGLIGAAVFVCIVLLGGHQIVEAIRTTTDAPPPTPPSAVPSPSVSPLSASSAARCDGRTSCGQMRSCADAKWVQRNCPGAAMDGDGDGVPCETQWCR
jgi:cold shock CspA family protein